MVTRDEAREEVKKEDGELDVVSMGDDTVRVKNDSVAMLVFTTLAASSTEMIVNGDPAVQ